MVLAVERSDFDWFQPTKATPFTFLMDTEATEGGFEEETSQKALYKTTKSSAKYLYEEDT